MFRAGTSGRRRAGPVATAAACAAGVLFAARPAAADAGIPMLAVMWPLSWLTFIPVVLIEAMVARRVLELGTRDSLKVSLFANGWSTVVGIPLTWIGLTIIEMMVGFLMMGLPDKVGRVGYLLLMPFMAPWIGPEVKPWTVAAAAAVLCVPFFFASVKIEAWSASRFAPMEQARRWAWIGNSITYGVICAILLGAALVSYLRS